MDQIKIGKFIAECRKSVGLTQMQLAERLNITDRAVSKWETGKSLPDASIMLELCGVLKITVNDLLSGEVVAMENYAKETESKLIELVKEKEESDKRLLRMEIWLGICCALPLHTGLLIALLAPIEEWLQIVIILLGLVPLLAATPFMLKIEQRAGYYECQCCKHRHIPRYATVFFAMHLQRARYMRCPRCNKLSWQKKVISKE